MLILVVEDERSMRQLISAVLLNEGIATEVIQCENVDLALLDLAVQPVDLIISDWNMPGMSGLDLLRKVRGDAAFAHVRQVPFVLLTSETRRENILQAIEAGVTDYVVKPFTPGTLTDKIMRIVAPSGARPPAR